MNANLQAADETFKALKEQLAQYEAKDVERAKAFDARILSIERAIHDIRNASVVILQRCTTLFLFFHMTASPRHRNVTKAGK